MRVGRLSPRLRPLAIGICPYVRKRGCRFSFARALELQRRSFASAAEAGLRPARDRASSGGRDWSSATAASMDGPWSRSDGRGYSSPLPSRSPQRSFSPASSPTGRPRAGSPVAASVDATRRQAEAVAAEANRKLRTLSLGPTPRQASPRPAGGGADSQTLEHSSAEMRLALASRRHADSAAASYPRSPLPVDALTRHALASRDNWGASPRALEYREAMRPAPSSPSGTMQAGGGSSPRVAGLPSPMAAVPGSPRLQPTTEAEAVHHTAVYDAQRDLSHSLRYAGRVAASPTAFRSQAELQRQRQQEYLDPHRPGGPAATDRTASASITSLQAKADLAANKLKNMLPERAPDAGAPIAYSGFSAAGGAPAASPRRTQPAVSAQAAAAAAARSSGPAARAATDRRGGTTFSSEMARSPGALLKTTLAFAFALHASSFCFRVCLIEYTVRCRVADTCGRGDVSGGRQEAAAPARQRERLHAAQSGAAACDAEPAVGNSPVRPREKCTRDQRCTR